MTDKKHFYRIGEIAKEFDVNASLLRYWEKELEPLIVPQRNKRGVRLYTYDDFETFKQIHTLVKVEGMTLKGAKTKIQQQGKALKDQHDVVRSLLNIKDFLQQIKQTLDRK